MKSFLSLFFASTAAAAVNVTTCGKNTYSYNSLAGFGLVPSNAVDKYGDTLGGYGSAIAIDQASWKQLSNGSYVGTLWALPDRGWNTQGTVNFQSRLHKFSILFTPNPSASVASPSPANLGIVYKDTILLTDLLGVPLTGLDPTNTLNFPLAPILPQATYPGDGYGGDGPGGKRISLDAEGLVLIPGGGFWISDEYAPYIYRFTPSGRLISVISPPDAFIPRRKGVVNFSSNNPPLYNTSQVPDPVNPEGGRSNNQGFEGLAISPDGRTLTAALQSALIQDGGTADDTRRYSRVLTWDITNPLKAKLKKEYVLPLPVYVNSKGNKKVAGQSEIHAVTDTDYLVLSRDSGRGYGQGKKNTESVYRHIDVFSIADAKSVDGGSVDKINGTVAPGGVLNSDIKPATYCSWLDFNVNSELGKFGLHNGGNEDSGLLNEKWESIAIVPVKPNRYWKKDNADRLHARDLQASKKDKTQDVFIFSVSDNDFITQDGSLNFGKYKYKDASGYNVNSQFLVFQATIPAA